MSIELGFRVARRSQCGFRIAMRSHRKYKGVWKGASLLQANRKGRKQRVDTGYLIWQGLGALLKD